MTGERLIRLRQQLGLTQEGLGRLLDVSFATINRWEREATSGPHGPVLAFLKALETALQHDPQLGARLDEWIARGSNFLWAQVFELAHRGQSKTVERPRKRG
jgi:transcriptional regulator with XRE-family HTH domain